MAKTILGEAVEQLKQIPKGVAKQTVKLPAELGKTAVLQVTGGKRVDPLTGLEIPTPEKLKKLKKKEGRVKATGITQARQLISQSASRRTAGEVPSYIAGKPGFTLEQKEKRKELPPPVSASKPKWGTAERKLGVSG